MIFLTNYVWHALFMLFESTVVEDREKIWHVVADFAQPTRLPMSWGSWEMPLQLSPCGRYCLTILGAISYQLSDLHDAFIEGSEWTCYIKLSSKSEGRFLFQCLVIIPECFATGYSQLPKSWRNPKNLEISLGEGFCGSRGDAAFSLCLG